MAAEAFHLKHKMSHVCNKMRINVSTPSGAGQDVRQDTTADLLGSRSAARLTHLPPKPPANPDFPRPRSGFSYKFSLMVFVGEGYFPSKRAILKMDGNTDMTVCVEQKLGYELVFSTIKRAAFTLDAS